MYYIYAICLLLLHKEKFTECFNFLGVAYELAFLQQDYCEMTYHKC